MSLTTIHHKGKAIIFADYKNCTSQEEIFDLLDRTTEMLKSHAEGALVLVDFTNQHGSRDYLAKSKEFNMNYGHKISKRAVLGISGMKKVLLAGYNKLSGKGTKAIPFDTKEEALDYLVS